MKQVVICIIGQEYGLVLDPTNVPWRQENFQASSLNIYTWWILTAI